jgi:2,3-dimethylmalate lyase
VNPGAAQLRKMLAEGRFVRFAGVCDALSARIAERAGFDAVWISGFAMAASMLGKPDIGLITLSEMAERVRQITAAVSIPVVVDGEAGYGNALNVMRTVQEFVQAGAAGMQLGDESNETCPYLGMPTRILDEQEAVLKYQAAIEARGESGLFIVSAPQVGYARMMAYAKAGIDGVFFPWTFLIGEKARPDYADAMKTLQTTATLPIAVTAPFLPPVHDDTLKSFGYRMVVRAVEGVYATARVQTELWSEYMRTGTTAGFYDRMFTKQSDFLPIVDADRFRSLADAYLGSAYQVHDERVSHGKK